MNPNSPAVGTSASSPGRSHPVKSSPNNQLVLSESEAMRRVKDLLSAGKLSVHDIVVFKYCGHSFTASVMANGSIRSNVDPKLSKVKAEKPSSQSYSSPSEFASTMAANVAIFDEKFAKAKGRITINGWNSCTVNGRSLAAIRNEMLHERKNELASFSTEKIREPTPSLMTGNVSERQPEENLKLCENPITDRATGLSPSSHGFDVSSRNGPEALLCAHQSLSGKKQPILFTCRTKNKGEEYEKGVVMNKQDVATSFEEGSGPDSPIRARSFGKSTLLRTPPSRDVSTNPTSERGFMEPKDSRGASAKNTIFHEMLQDRCVSKSVVERGAAPTSLNMVKLAAQTSTANKDLGFPQLQDDHYVVAKDGPGIKQYVAITRDEKIAKKLELTSTPAAEPLHPAERKEQTPNVCLRSVCEDVRSQGSDVVFRMSSSSRPTIDATNELKGSSRESQGCEKKGDSQFISVEPRDEVYTTPRENITPQARSSKEVADLQQEILGDSDSDEENFLEQEKGGMHRPKKRSYSPSSDEQRKKTRTGDYLHPGINDADSRSGNVQGLTFEEKTVSNDHMKTETEAVDLDPDTLEAAAIAAQIEKEEASTRARRTTRLAAGKIKQVDYKASTGLQVPRAVSPEFGWEENNKRSIEAEPSFEIARTTRRRSTSNQLQPPQRSSRRVAKTRNSYEKDISPIEETGYLGAGSSGGGNGCDTRSDRECVQNEDIEGKESQGFRPSSLRSDSSDRRRGRTESLSKRTRHQLSEDGDLDSHGRAYSTRASTRENSVVDGTETADPRGPDEFFSDAEDLQNASEDDDNDDGSDTPDLKISSIKCLAEAVRLCESADPKLILSFLNEQDHSKCNDSKKQRAQEALEEVMECFETLLTTQKTSTNSAQVLSFLSAEFCRLSTGGNVNRSSGKPAALVRRASKEDQIRASSERSRKKEHRDVEELRANLEKEMESRRRAELDALFAEIHFCEVDRAVAREKAKCCHLTQEAKQYRGMERMMRERLDGAKILVGQLRGETDGSDAIGIDASSTPLRDDTREGESLTNGSFVLASLRTGRNERIAEDDVTMTNKNVTTTSRRLMEMDRLRALIAAREVEAEELQRICEKERIQVVSTLELKTRIETEIYLSKSQGSVTHGFGTSSTIGSGAVKDGFKKGDTRSGSTHPARGIGYTKQKAGSFGKNVTAVQLDTDQKQPLPGSRPKPGRATEVSKQVKRKPFGRNGGNGNDRY